MNDKLAALCTKSGTIDSSPMRSSTSSRKAVWLALLIGSIVILTSLSGLVLYLGRADTTSLASVYGTVLIPDQQMFRANNINRQAVKWLASRWKVPEEQIYMMVEDSEPWMQILGLLDVHTLSSARIWILNTTHNEGKAWEDYLMSQGVPHNGNAYLFREYNPSEAEKPVAANFYSTKTFWLGSPLGGLAIIEDIRWTDTLNVSGNIIAYQSQKHLPSITIPIREGSAQKWQAFQTPVR